ncbi:hypothetical protein BU202_06450 [Streptococcus cuniculi]|uniref:GNAT family acetyltransferase n=1 Tax=Streptococcus cuniculi TaxID=1432788 RepID=A0A1Q8E7A8_9STRE|nr:hypothetical protein [Streptococcus cuniculi]OLF47667.1 hypothetical protein BU202_06450 [Streptococcus cuniculi]
MTALQVHFQPNSVVIYHKNQCIGTIDFHKNPYHHQHTYLKCHLKQYDTSLAPSLFQVIRQHTKQPLQVMLDSTDQTRITFLESGGFRCLRKCYQMDVSAQDYLGNPEPCDFQIAEQASSIYNRCCQLLLDYYKETHEAISPFTGSKEDFFNELPSTVYYHTAHNEIQSLAFIEDNEIMGKESRTPPFPR